PDLDIVMAPVGGGGLASGTAIAAHGMSTAIRVVAAEPEQADDAFRSLKAGKILPSVNPRTIADGLRTALGELTFAVISREVEQIVTVSEESIVEAMKLIWERAKIVVEPSGAVPVAALIDGKFAAHGARVGVIISGGNVDLDRLPWINR
ncbi:MAG TPA: pyridoxal-phosphate dependent enzyme, partial [Spirochaetia bacterium]|nr:pyridoxal-phosphate dependent enzyme [Spirochaetia bacterium]